MLVLMLGLMLGPPSLRTANGGILAGDGMLKTTIAAYVMRPLRYSINVTLDGCCDHRAIPPDEDLHRHAIENIDHADALLFGGVTYEMMEAAFRPPQQTGARPDWMDPFARAIHPAKKYVVSSTLDRVDWRSSCAVIWGRPCSSSSRSRA